MSHYTDGKPIEPLPEYSVTGTRSQGSFPVWERSGVPITGFRNIETDEPILSHDEKVKWCLMRLVEVALEYGTAGVSIDTSLTEPPLLRVYFKDECTPLIHCGASFAPTQITEIINRIKNP